ncbi:14193_t:CDS:2 [Gigaspora rosea]|nr:14193_t:CDS:2 [Gigaspora rosea]
MSHQNWNKLRTRKRSCKGQQVLEKLNIIQYTKCLEKDISLYLSWYASMVFDPGGINEITPEVSLNPGFPINLSPKDFRNRFAEAALEEFLKSSQRLLGPISSSYLKEAYLKLPQRDIFEVTSKRHIRSYLKDDLKSIQN